MASSLEDLLMARDTLIFILQHLRFLIKIKNSYLEPTSTLETDFEPSHGEPPQRTESSTVNPRKGESNSQGNKQINWEVIIHSNSSPSNTHPLSSFPKSTDSEISLSQLFRRESDNFGRDKEITVIVKRKFNSLQQEVFNLSPTTNNSKLRYIITNLESELSRPDNRGPWSMEERMFYIKVLELKAAKLAIMSFTLKEGDAISIRIHMGIMTVLSYLMKIGGTKNQELTAISKEI